MAPLMRLSVLFASLLLVALLGPAAPASAAAPCLDASGASVRVYNYRYRDDAGGKAVTQIRAGQSVTWTWCTAFHSVTSGFSSFTGASGPAYDSGVLDQYTNPPDNTVRTTFSVTFPQAGIFGYYCVAHEFFGDNDVNNGGLGPGGMKGVVVVTA